jgi:hypothetical protein
MAVTKKSLVNNTASSKPTKTKSDKTIANTPVPANMKPTMKRI